MLEERWLLPEGIDELLPREAARLERLRRALLDLYQSWGYELVITPFIEFLDSLLTGAGTELDLQTFKLIDQVSGRLLGVRADITPQAARIDAHRLQRDAPTRLCYIGTVLRAKPDAVGASRSPLQVGAELYGHAGAASDVEILALMSETLKTAGVRDVHVDLGHVGIFRALARAAGLNADQERVLFQAMQRKARAEIERLVKAFGVPRALRGKLAGLVEYSGGMEVLRRARRQLRGTGRAVARVVDDLQAIAERAQASIRDVQFDFDLAELRGYHYQTGMVFAAYAPGFGQEVARGGRYDEIGKVFGRARPATGFSADLKVLMELADTGAEAPPRAILAPAAGDDALEALITRLRAAGEIVIRRLDGQRASAAELGCDREIRRRGGDWAIVKATRRRKS